MIRKLTIPLAAFVAVGTSSVSAQAQPRIIEIPTTPAPRVQPVDPAVPKAKLQPTPGVVQPENRYNDPRWTEAVFNGREKLAQVEKTAATLAKARAEYETVKDKFDKKTATADEHIAAANKVEGAEVDLRRAVLELAQAEAQLQYLDRLLRPCPIPSGPIEVVRPLPYPQSKLPARNGFPNPQTDLALAQLDSDVWNVRIEGAKLELARLESIGADKSEIDAARARLDAAKAAAATADDRVLKLSKKLYGW